MAQSDQSTRVNAMRRRWIRPSSLPSTSPFGAVEDGKADLRGFPVKSLGSLRRATFKNVDFSYADFSNMRIEDCTFLECRFRKSDFSSSHDEHNLFKDCTFDRS